MRDFILIVFIHISFVSLSQNHTNNSADLNQKSLRATSNFVAIYYSNGEKCFSVLNSENDTFHIPQNSIINELNESIVVLKDIFQQRFDTLYYFHKVYLPKETNEVLDIVNQYLINNMYTYKSEDLSFYFDSINVYQWPSNLFENSVRVEPEDIKIKISDSKTLIAFSLPCFINPSVCLLYHLSYSQPKNIQYHISICKKEKGVWTILDKIVSATW